MRRQEELLVFPHMGSMTVPLFLFSEEIKERMIRFEEETVA